MTSMLRRLASLCVAIPLGVATVAAEPRHGLSVFGDLKYQADFKHFDYVNPDAPRTGRLSLVGPAAIRSFDSFNSFILRGDPAQGLSLLYDTLMEGAGDEPGSGYGLIAETADVAADGLSVTFRLRPEARFSDGKPVTAEDVVFTLDILKSKGHPSYRITLRDVVKAEALDRHTVRFVFQGALVRDLPLTVAGLAVLPKHYYDTQPFDETTLKVPVGSGPYTIGEFKHGQQITYKRRPDYWAKDLPVNRGRYNFDEIRYEYYRDRTAELESLKAGGIDLREEFTARDWVTGYDIPAVKDGRLVKLTMPDETPSGTQGFFFNTRRAKFQDPRVRQAIGLAFDYEWTNKNLFYGLYTRTESYFENSDMKAKGPPTPDEAALLEPFRSKLPPSVFGEPYSPPKSDGSGTDRRLLREALKLLSEAGWRLETKNGAQALVNAKGEQLELEFLDAGGSTFERIIAPYIKNLQSIGIKASLRFVDSAQYQSRVKKYDFDIVSSRFTMGLTPGIELFTYLGSSSAESEGSSNLAGIKDPVIDALIEKVIDAKSRPQLVTAARAIDRVLRASHYWVPHWYKAAHNIVHWDKFSRPRIKPKYARGIIDTWWYDETKAAKLNR
ncbi:MAG: extracellular solute-binding protein [Hyphomicrobiaceae bacterium]|nr:extracellular solute-binding protein [Hyphomicrobiaceae bacterium]